MAGRRVLWGILLAGALGLYLFANSAGTLCVLLAAALPLLSAVSLLLPLLIAGMLAACFNGQAVGGAARVWLKFAPVLLLIAILIQMKSYRFEWLTPLLGPAAQAGFPCLR